jgi:hypothetical protein
MPQIGSRAIEFSGGRERASLVSAPARVNPGAAEERLWLLTRAYLVAVHAAGA